ncbi:MAG: hypothetical protein ACE5FR_12470 [Rhodospirillales bacterium]
MKAKRIMSGALVAGTLLTGTALIGAPAFAHGSGMGHGRGSMGGGMMGMMGPGHGKAGEHGMMERRGMGPGRGEAGEHGTKDHRRMMGRHSASGCNAGMMGDTSVDKNLSVEDVTKILEGRLAWFGNDRLKVGKVEAKDGKTILAEILTVDNSLVERLAFDRKTGWHKRIQ